MAEVEENLETAGEVCMEMGGVDAFVADTAQRQEQLWEARKCLFDAYKTYWEIDEVDACVPRNRIPDYIEGVERVAQEKGVKKVCLDRGGYLYHGRVKAFADAARQGGLEF